MERNTKTTGIYELKGDGKSILETSHARSILETFKVKAGPD